MLSRIFHLPNFLHIERNSYSLPEHSPYTADWRHRYEFGRQLVNAIQDMSSCTKTVKYAQIMELDRKITDLPTPTHLRAPQEGLSLESDGPMAIMQRIVPLICRDACKCLPLRFI